MNLRGKTFRNLLIDPKDKDNITNKSGVIYRFKCTQEGFKEGYIGEMVRSSGDRLKEHLRAPNIQTWRHHRSLLQCS